jgi:hypothetical protein
MTEDQLQSECFQWAWNTFPDTRRLLFHVPNERDTGIPSWIKKLLKEHFPLALEFLIRKSNPKIQGMRNKVIGVVSGVADLLFLWHGKTFAFELKVGSNKQSENQKLWEITATPHIEKYYLITNFEDFKFHFTEIVLNLHT